MHYNKQPQIVRPVSHAIPSSGTDYQRNLKIAIYSHDTMGLGHMRRNMLIAQALVNSDLNVSILLIAGSQEAGFFSMPGGVDRLTLPALHKGSDGQYQSKHLDISLQDLTALRAESICASLKIFKPDVLIVDKEPFGSNGELKPTLSHLRNLGNTKLVLGLRDILDESSVVRHEWTVGDKYSAVRNYYDEIWVYGDPKIYDMIHEYGFTPDMAAKVRYTGYLDQRARLELTYCGNNEDPCLESCLSFEPFVLCMVGGGQDGDKLAEAFIKAELPKGSSGIIITGPYMRSEIRERLIKHAANNNRFNVIRFVSEPTKLIQHADCVITMGGYNTISETLSFNKRTLVIPRIIPRKEQLIRAECLSKIGALCMLHPDQLEPEVLSKWINDNTRKPAQELRNQIDLNGLIRIPRLLKSLLSNLPDTTQNFHLKPRGLCRI